MRAFAAGARRPFANSMMADVYKLMPNSTDASEFLPEGYGTINLALSEGVAYYHTRLDSLANLDPRSVKHMGDLALGSLKATFKGEAPPGQLAYTDLLSRMMIVMPQWAAFALILVGGLVASIAFWRVGGARPARALLVPPLTLLAAFLFSWACSGLFGHFRPEACDAGGRRWRPSQDRKSPAWGRNSWRPPPIPIRCRQGSSCCTTRTMATSDVFASPWKRATGAGSNCAFRLKPEQYASSRKAGLRTSPRRVPTGSTVPAAPAPAGSSRSS